LFAIALALVVLVALVLFYKYKGRGQKIASIERRLEQLENCEHQGEDVKEEIKKLYKLHHKLIFKTGRTESDSDKDSDETPVAMFTRFLRDSFVEGFQSDNKLIQEEFIAAFNKIKDKVPQTGDDTRHSAGDGLNRASRPEPPTHRSSQESPSDVIEMHNYDGDNM
jgi:hypothetical protein